jgi:hypothetical protein
VSASKSWWQAKPTPRQCFIVGTGFFVIGTLQLLLAAIVGGHVLN